jgi:hypothetical protein
MKRKYQSLKDIREFIIQDYLDELSITDIVEKYNSSQSAIHNLLSGRTYGSLNKVRNAEVKNAGKPVKIIYENGKETKFSSVQECAEFLSLSSSHVSNVLTQNNDKYKLPNNLKVRYDISTSIQ